MVQEIICNYCGTNTAAGAFHICMIPVDKKHDSVHKTNAIIKQLREDLAKANEVIEFLEVSYEKSQQVEKELLTELQAEKILCDKLGNARYTSEIQHAQALWKKAREV